MRIWAAASLNSASPAREGAALAGSVRVCCFPRGALAFFAYGFAKSDREILCLDELETFRLLADAYLLLDRTGLSAA